MQRFKNRTLSQACKKASVNNNTQMLVIEEMIYQYYAMIANDIKNADFNDTNSFLSYNLPFIGKVYASDKAIEHIKRIKNDRSKV